MLFDFYSYLYGSKTFSVMRVKSVESESDSASIQLYTYTYKAIGSGLQCSQGTTQKTCR